MRLSLNDYKSILSYYEIDTTKLKANDIKQQAENILAEKLCRCIKKVDKKNVKKETTSNSESKAIAICKNSIFTKKHLKISKFKCKKSARLLPKNHSSKKKNNISVIKTEKKIKLRKSKK